MKAVPFLVMCLSCASANLLAQPVFYAGENCTGDVDPASALWGYSTKNDVTVKPFSSKDWYSGYALYQCMTDSSITYSVMLKIDSTACPGNGEDVLQLLYWKDSTTCEGTATSETVLTAGSCVGTPLGSAIFSPTLTTAQLCTVTNYRAALQTGGFWLRDWKGALCYNGIPSVDDKISESQQACGNVKPCEGCCPHYSNCQRVNRPYFRESLAACNKLSDNTWQGAMATLGFNDDKCTQLDNENTEGMNRKLGSCETFKIGGTTYSSLLELQAPLTMGIYCEFVQLNVNLSVDGFLSWDEFNKRVNGAPAAHPVSVLALVVLLVTVLF
eukprot:TRINITY_DN49_c0_g1_i2.p1 TRINITY_DN49_c0_g1~~TRINITY_DN49_c0_g1_i2.p1  ORF type:complete len:328 (+),score=80.86 TRINITY_DN49_c0_g1_i2:69-1052(+)